MKTSRYRHIQPGGERMTNRISMAVATSLAFGLLVSPAHAEQAQPPSDENGVAAVLEHVAPPETVIEPERSAAGLVADTGSAVVRIPRDVDGTVKIKGDDGSRVAVGLPDTGSVGPVATAADGTAVFEDAAGKVDIAVQPVAEGARIATVINEASAPTEYVYPVNVPGGGGLAQQPDGSVTVIDADGNPLARVEIPWAKDSTGASVPTHFEVRGDRLVQVVEHAGFVYPVVAGPLVRHWWGLSWQLNRRQTNNLMFGMAGATAAALYVPDPSVSKAVAAVLADSAGYANWAYNKGACLAVARAWNHAMWAYHYYGGSCR
jgi:hypothetical protein